MTRRHFAILAAVVVTGALRVWTITPGVPAGSGALPARLGDREFWTLSTALSEPDGYFRSENLVSNEMAWPSVIPDLRRGIKARRVYLGVGPEQNFTYIAALDPAMAFILDIRRGNLHLHLMYKALFELSADRAEFVSRLFSLKRPDDLGPRSTAAEIFAAYERAGVRNERLYRETLTAIRELYLFKRRLPLGDPDLKGIEYVLSQFYSEGLAIHYTVMPERMAGMFPTYPELMTAGAETAARSFLGTEENYQRVKLLQSRNLLVPVVGNFGGPKALRAIARYLKQNSATVGAFYLSNVEQYLRRERSWAEFCENAATLPVDTASVFIRSERGRYGPLFGPVGTGPGSASGRPFGPRLPLRVDPIAAEVRDCAAAR